MSRYSDPRPGGLPWLAALILSALLLPANDAHARRRARAPRIPTPPAVDVSAVRDKLEVFHDGKGHYLVAMHYKHSRDVKGGASRYVFYGDGRTFYRAPTQSAGRNKEDFNYGIYDPRVLSTGRSQFEVRGGKASFNCEGRVTALTMMEPGKAAKMLKRGKFLDVYWNRRSHALARNEDGVYYYVDRLARKDKTTGSLRGFQVYSGQRGNVRPLRMKNVVSDPKGEIFITADGRLKLMLDNSQGRLAGATWVAGKRRSQLTVVPLNLLQTRVFIYRELGVYSGQKLHRPCDDW